MKMIRVFKSVLGKDREYSINMNTSLKWIKDLVPGLDCTPQEYMDAMTLSGSKVEGYENMDEDLEKIVIGQVKALRNIRMQTNL